MGTNDPAGTPSPTLCSKPKQAGPRAQAGENMHPTSVCPSYQVPQQTAPAPSGQSVYASAVDRGNEPIRVLIRQTLDAQMSRGDDVYKSEGIPSALFRVLISSLSDCHDEIFLRMHQRVFVRCFRRSSQSCRQGLRPSRK